MSVQPLGPRVDRASLLSDATPNENNWKGRTHMKDFAGKFAVITGSGTGMGQLVADAS